MPASSLLALIDDIATMLDDVSVMTKVAVKKTAGVLGDDLALNAEQVTGFSNDRELSVVWAVAKGSLVNKAILVPAALAISAFIPWAITPLLMIGGTFLCFEGVEKLLHAFLHGKEDEAHAQELHIAVADPAADLVAVEKDKIKGAVRTDFILSAEIIVISLGTIAGAAFSTQVATLVSVALIITLSVYGLVALIVKIDDAGLYFYRQPGSFSKNLGQLLLAAAPRLMKLLSVFGTAAMFMVGGGILTHGWSALHHLSESLVHSVESLGGIGFILKGILPLLFDVVVGLIIGAIVVAVVMLGKKLFKKA
jgi:uncharacterized protein